MHCYGKVKTKMGEFWVGCSPKGIALISPAHDPPKAFESAYMKRLGVKPLRGILPRSFTSAVQKAAAGRPFKPVSIDLSSMSEFQREVLKKLQRVPRGEVRPYAWLAREAGRPKAVRAVGNTMARNPVPFLVPCHRVVPTSGGVGDYGYGSARKRELLSQEGVAVDEIEKLERKGVRYVGSSGTKTYCFPTCLKIRNKNSAKQTPFASTNEARQAGYTPCSRCRPDPGSE